MTAVRIVDASGDPVDGETLTLAVVDGALCVHNGFHWYPIEPGTVTVDAL